MDANPRKLPRQSRSKATFGAIVEATTQLLLREGFDKFTTARVAKRAGVSIGSLYQYFPNKAALAAAVIDRCCEEFLAAFGQSLERSGGGHLRDFVRGMVEETLVSHHLAPDLHRIVNELAQRIGVEDKTAAVSRSAARMIETRLRDHSDEIRSGIDIAVAATIIETVLEALSHRVSLADPPSVAPDVLTEEATQLIARYLSARV
jgi:AcrR family transcriptional regulator